MSVNKSTASAWLASIVAIAAAFGEAHAQSSRDYIYIVGSSTVYPFSTIIAERFGRYGEFRTPKVEPTGSGGGLKLFCDGVGVDHPDISNASRAIKPSELSICAENGVRDIIEIKFGYDGIVVARSAAMQPISLTRRDIYLALARWIPGLRNGDVVANPNRTWQDVNPSLPDLAIEVFGPPPTSGTRDAFVEVAMEAGCQATQWVRALQNSDTMRYYELCHTIREDGAFVEAGENDNVIVHKLVANPGAFGIFGFNFLDQNGEKVNGASIDGVEPSADTIASGEYPISRPLFFYVKKTHVRFVPGLRRFLGEITSERAWGDQGYLADRGLVPLPIDERRRIATSVRELTTLASSR